MFSSLQAGRARRTGGQDSSVPTSRSTPGITGVPDYGAYTGYIACDMAITGLKNAGQEPDPSELRRRHPQDQRRPVRRRRPHVLADRPQLRELRQDRQRRAAPGSSASKDGKFKVLNNGKPITGKLVGDPDAHRAVRAGQHRWGHHDGAASDRGTLTRPRSSYEGSRFAGSPRRVRDARRARGRIAAIRYAPRPAIAETLGRSVDWGVGQ